MKFQATICLALIVLTSAVPAEEPASSASIIDHHFASIGKGDLDAILSDYADDAFMITGRGVVKGKDAIRAVYARMTKDGTVGIDMKVIARFAEKDVAHAVWTQDGGGLKSAATLVVRDGKIVSQIVVTGLIPDKT
jgi:ketosteroid isomerase-like protein